MADGAWRRTVHCKDALDRDRSLTVALSEDGRHLTITPPPGEAAVLDLISGGDTLKRVIGEAQQAATNRLLGIPAPALAGGLREASTFYVLDANDQVVPLGVGLSGFNVAVSGPRWWQSDTGNMITITAKLASLVQTSRDLRRG